jgi:hypothetical protein
MTVGGTATGVRRGFAKASQSKNRPRLNVNSVT